LKVGIVSDIHGNFPALRAVINAGELLGVSQWLCLGDLLGYYYWPKQCIATLRLLSAKIIAGNHDRLTCLARRDVVLLRKLGLRYGQGSLFATQQLSEADFLWVEHLPDQLVIELCGKRILMCHGSPWDAESYVYPDANFQTVRRMAVPGFDCVFYGHTHYPVTWCEDGVFLINPGSVGQPRNRQPGAHWVLWNTETNVFEHLVETYDFESVLSACKCHDPDLPYLHDVLVRN
jgi:putative phosphoesterase